MTTADSEMMEDPVRPDDTLWRLETLALSGGGPGEQAVRRQLWSAVDLVVHLARRGSARKVETITAVDPTGCREIDNASDHVRARVFGRSI